MIRWKCTAIVTLLIALLSIGWDAFAQSEPALTTDVCARVLAVHAYESRSASRRSDDLVQVLHENVCETSHTRELYDAIRRNTTAVDGHLQYGLLGIDIDVSHGEEDALRQLREWQTNRCQDRMQRLDRSQRDDVAVHVIDNTSAVAAFSACIRDVAAAVAANSSAMRAGLTLRIDREDTPLGGEFIVRVVWSPQTNVSVRASANAFQVVNATCDTRGALPPGTVLSPRSETTVTCRRSATETGPVRVGLNLEAVEVSGRYTASDRIAPTCPLNALGVPCASSHACVVSRTQCVVDAVVCAQAGPSPAGTSCGTESVCDGNGACIASCGGWLQPCCGGTTQTCSGVMVCLNGRCGAPAGWYGYPAYSYQPRGVGSPPPDSVLMDNCAPHFGPIVRTASRPAIPVVPGRQPYTHAALCSALGLVCEFTCDGGAARQDCNAPTHPEGAPDLSRLVRCVEPPRH